METVDCVLDLIPVEVILGWVLVSCLATISNPAAIVHRKSVQKYGEREGIVLAL